MKKLLTSLSLVILVVFMVSCGKAAVPPVLTPESPGTPETSTGIETPVETPAETPAETPVETPAEGMSLETLYPFTPNVEKVFEGMGNEFASFVENVDFIEGNKMQVRMNNGGTEMVTVIERTEDAIKVVYEEGEVYYRENFLSKATNTSRILLMEPIAVGTTWMNNGNEKNTITAIDKTIKTPYGEMEAVEVTTDSETSGGPAQTLNYYAEGLGLVMRVSKGAGYEVSSLLKELKTDATWKKVINFYYPNSDEKITLYRKNFDFKTNDIPRNLIMDAYKDVPDKVLGVLTPNTKVNYLYLNKDGMVYVDLSKDFITEMNLGSGFEMMVLQSLANTLGDYYGVSKVMLTIDGGTYESGHILLEKFEPLEVNYDGVIDMN